MSVHACAGDVGLNTMTIWMEDPPCRDVAATSCRVDAATASELLVPQIMKRDVERIVGEQIGGVLSATDQEAWIVEGPHLVPAEFACRIGRQIRLWMRLRLSSWRPSWKLHLRSACRSASRILSLSRSWMSRCPRIARRTVLRSYYRIRVQNRMPEQTVVVPMEDGFARSYHRSACSFARRSRLWMSSCLRSRRTGCPSYHRQRVQNHTPEQIVDVLVPQIVEAVVAVTPQTCVQLRTQEQIVDVLVPQITEDVACTYVPQAARAKSYAGADCECPRASDHGGRVVASLHHRSVCRITRRSRSWIFTVPQIMEAPVEVLLSPYHRNACRIARSEQIVDFPVPRTIEAIVEVVPSPPHEQIVDIPVPQIMEAPVEVLLSPSQERVQNRTLEQIVDFLVLQTHGDNRRSCAVFATRKRAELHAGADRGYPRASDHGGNCGTDFCGAPDHGEIWACASARAFRADPRTTRGCGFHQRSGQVQHASTWRCYGLCASDHGGCRGGL